MKKARIRYEAATPEAWEGFNLEIWDNKLESWELVCKVECTQSVKYPNANSNDFIHWDILRQISQLSRAGYSIDM